MTERLGNELVRAVADDREFRRFVADVLRDAVRRATDDQRQPGFLSREDAAAYTGLSTTTLEHLSPVRLPRYKPTGGKVFYKVDDLDRFMVGG